MRVRALTLIVVLAGLAAAPAQAAPRALRPFGSCTALLDYARSHAVRAVRTGWAPTPMFIEGPRPVGVPVSTKGGEIAPQASAGQDNASSGAGESFSTTNVQEQGVDEPDVVKTDGTTIYAVANGWLHAIDTTGDAPVIVGAVQLDEGYGHELLLHGDRLIVVQSAWLTDDPQYGRPVTRLTEIDVSDPSAMKVLRHERDDGEYVSARMTGDTARVVVASRAPVMFAVAQAGGPSRRAVVGKRLRQVRRAKLAAWRPHTFFRPEGKPKQARFHALTRCGEMRHTARFSGLDTITVLTVDMARGLPSVDALGVMSDAQIVYGSADRLYVATQRWLSPQMLKADGPEQTTTQIHELDTSQPDRTTYVASGTVDGYLLDQFALSQDHGVLRVAATGNDDSAVTTLDTATMTQLGRVAGLGQGERIYAVRFIGDTAYVVTFRQVDPLYTVDLSDPAHPRVAGELKLAGYSAYLHPVGDDLLLGVGQDAGADGRTTGSQLSLFDVSDPAHPTRLAKRAIAGGSSSAEYDHHAFLYWPKTKLAVIPVSIYDYDEQTGAADQFVGAIGFRVERTGIDEVGRIEHPADDQALWDIQRATVIGDRLFTLSAAGMMASPLATLGTGPFAAFPDKPASIGYGGCGDSGVAAPGAPVASCAPMAR
ncbi:MAG: benzoate transporter [Solirubrobacterales bacterium]|nr:benzoate transporter [Solirubrobacterales bacterium]